MLRVLSSFLSVAWLIVLHSETGLAQQPPAAQAALPLADLERMALEKNPTLAQAQAAADVSRGRARQAGLYPNPNVAFAATEISKGPVIRGGEQGLLVQQNIPLGDRFGLGRQVFEQEVQRAESVAKAQRLRVLNSVRVLFYRALAAQRKVELRQTLVSLYQNAVSTTRQLVNVGQADAPDLLEIEIEHLQAENAVIEARNDLAAIWSGLTAVIGDPELVPAPLAGALDELPSLDIQNAVNTLLRDSPEVKAAQSDVARSELALRQARAGRIPDLVVGAGVHYNRERLETGGRPIGWQGSVEVGIELPLFNRNQGAIDAARAELEKANREVDRVRLSLRARLAPVYRDYLNLRDLAVKYNEGMLPRARRAFELYEAGFRQMAAAYPQVLIARRTMLQLQEQYDETLALAWEKAIVIQGMLLEGGLDTPVSGSAGPQP
jgi:cobalt-zinc-cadmium efflux system outer membrane protein